MGYLSQASSTIANTPKMTLSAWVRAATANPASLGGEWFPIISWGTRSNKVFGPSYLALNTNTNNDGNYLSGYFVGIPDSIDMAAYVSPSQWPADQGAVFTPNSGINVPNTNYTPRNAIYSAMLGPNVWMHLMLALDFTDASIKSAGRLVSGAGKAVCLVNGQHIGRLASAGLDSNLETQTHSSPDMPATFGTDKAWSVAANYQNYSGFRPAALNSGEWVPCDMTDDLNAITIPGWSMSVNGTEIGIPSQSADAASNKKIDFGDVQVYFGQYIDPQDTDNFSKFVAISGGHGYPADPTIAARAFGTQSLLFKGNKTAFLTNAGNGGAFTKTGTVNDFTPTPSN